MINDHSKIPTAIVGLGRAGWNLHFQPMINHGGFAIVSVADPVAGRRDEARALSGCETFDSIDQLLEKTPAELVVVATPSHFHFEDIRKVLKAGKHCVAEKPLAFTAEEADALVQLAQEKNLHLFVHHVHLHRDEFFHLHRIVESGILGPIFHMRAFWGGYSRRWDWQTLKKNGGGQLNNTCPHTLSVVLPLLGSKVIKVQADLRNIKDAGDAEDHVELFLQAENGATANVVVTSAMGWPGPKWTLAGKYGTLHSDGQTSRLRFYDPKSVAPLNVLDEAAPNREYLREQLPWQEEERKVEPTVWPGFIANVYDVLRKKVAPIVTPESAAEVVRVSEMARRSTVALQP